MFDRPKPIVPMEEEVIYIYINIYIYACVGVCNLITYRMHGATIKTFLCYLHSYNLHKIQHNTVCPRKISLIILGLPVFMLF